MIEQILCDLDETGYPVNLLERYISMILRHAKTHLSDSHLSPHDIELKIVARARSRVTS